MKTQKKPAETKQNKTKPKRNTHKTKNKTKNKTKDKQERVRKKKFILPTHPVFPNDFSHVLYLFFIKIPSAQSIYIIEIMLLVWCHFFLKAIVFFMLFKAISF